MARDIAEAQGLYIIDIASRDIDVPLSDLGREQALGLGRWFGALPAGAGPDAVLCSPYARAYETACLVRESGNLGPGVSLRKDGRLREKEFGILDRLTTHGIRQKHPELSEQRMHVGKFYFRPPGGERWCDVILRMRSLIEMMAREYAGRRVLVVGHQVIVSCMRYLIEHMDEAQILAIDRLGEIPNCGVTSYQSPAENNDDPRFVLQLVNFLAPLLEAGTPVTTAPDAAASPKD